MSSLELVSCRAPTVHRCWLTGTDVWASIICFMAIKVRVASALMVMVLFSMSSTKNWTSVPHDDTLAFGVLPVLEKGSEPELVCWFSKAPCDGSPGFTRSPFVLLMSLTYFDPEVSLSMPLAYLLRSPLLSSSSERMIGALADLSVVSSRTNTEGVEQLMDAEFCQ